MNELNFASLEASKKLVDNGIMLETEKVWVYARHIALKSASPSWMPVTKSSAMSVSVIPAPCFTDVWRELPHNTWVRKDYSGRTNVVNEDDSFICYNDNPTDALIYLLVWLKGEGNDQRRQKDCG